MFQLHQLDLVLCFIHSYSNIFPFVTELCGLSYVLPFLAKFVTVCVAWHCPGIGCVRYFYCLVLILCLS